MDTEQSMQDNIRNSWNITSGKWSNVGRVARFTNCQQVWGWSLLQISFGRAARISESDRARLLASSAERSADWLHASLQSVLRLQGQRIAAGLWLGAALVHPHRCVCEALFLADGHHGLVCRKSVGWHSRHNQMNGIVQRAFIQVLRSSQLENHWVSVRMENVRMALQRFHGKEAAAWHGTPHAQIHWFHLTYKQWSICH